MDSKEFFEGLVFEGLVNDRMLIPQKDGMLREETDSELRKRLKRKYCLNRKKKLSRYNDK